MSAGARRPIQPGGTWFQPCATRRPLRCSTRSIYKSIRSSHEPWRSWGYRLGDPTIVIIGGGIGGLTTALALARAGFAPMACDLGRVIGDQKCHIARQLHGSVGRCCLGATALPERPAGAGHHAPSRVLIGGRAAAGQQPRSNWKNSAEERRQYGHISLRPRDGADLSRKTYLCRHALWGYGLTNL